MFFIFILACRKYGFSFAVNTCGKLTMTLFPNNSFGNISIEQCYSRNFTKLFLKTIKEMKTYREKWGY